MVSSDLPGRPGVFTRTFSPPRNEDSLIILILRSILSSGSATGVDFLLLIFLVEVVNIHYLIAASLSFVAGTTITYIFSTSWIFSKRSLKNKKTEYTLYIFIGVIGVGLNALLMWLFTEMFHFHYILSKAVSGSMVFFYNFFVRKRLLFAAPLQDAIDIPRKGRSKKGSCPKAHIPT
jgi:putative flippase GtrA